MRDDQPVADDDTCFIGSHGGQTTKGVGLSTSYGHAYGGRRSMRVAH